MKTAKYGTWTSPITSDLIVAGSIRLSSPAFCEAGLSWLESRPQEKGRTLINHLGRDNLETDLTPAPFNVRSRVHEYGGGSWLLHENSIYFVNFSDQEIYTKKTDADAITQLTHNPQLRFADFILDAERGRLISVIEDHSQVDPSQVDPSQVDHSQTNHEPQNYLAAIDIESGEITPLHQGYDFYASPKISNGQLAWLCWNHPNMPWDGTELWLADLNAQADKGVLIAGGESESVFQPEFSADGSLFYVSDKSNWWNIYHYRNGKSECVLQKQAEFGLPQWVFGLKTYAVLDAEHLLCTYSENNVSKLALVNTTSGNLSDIALPFTHISDLCLDTSANKVAFIGASPTEFATICTLDLDLDLDQEMNTGNTSAKGASNLKRIKTSSSVAIDASYYSQAETLTYAVGKSDETHGFFYPPMNPDFLADKAELPPLLVKLHGGPTSFTENTLNLQIQYWTSRGFAVLDVNYRGSTGYGREYRDKLKKMWGVTDVEDASAGALYLAQSGRVDRNRLAIRGGSAGGYTTLAALTFTDTFAVGASYYGIGDLILLARDTHKFESRYTDGLVGAYPEEEALYKERSPFYHIDQLSCPVIFFQGADDEVVPPNQAQMMVENLKAKNLPVSYVLFEGEGHGFRQAANIKRALDLELYFYSRIFDFTPADDIEPVVIDNLGS